MAWLLSLACGLVQTVMTSVTSELNGSANKILRISWKEERCDGDDRVQQHQHHTLDCPLAKLTSPRIP